MKRIKRYIYLFSIAIGVLAVSAFVYYHPFSAEQQSPTVPEKQEEKNNTFLSSDYAKKHTLSTDEIGSKEKIFSMEEKEYYIFFYKEECIYCEETIPAIKQYVTSMMTGSPTMYFANMDMAEAQYLWAKSKDTFNMTPEVSDFEVIGTPTMLKVSGEEAYAYIGQEEIEQELEGVNLK